MSPTDHSLSPLLQQALAASAANDTAAALELLAQAGREEPGSPLPQFLLGAELAQSGRYPEAESAYAAAVLLAPEWAIARYELGTLQFTSGRAALAFITWEPLLALPDNDPLRLFVLGYGELAKDAFSAALSYFERGVSANTVNAPLNRNIRLLIDAILPMLPSSSQPSPARGDAGDAGTEDAGHFLLSAYHKGPLH